MDDAVQIRDLEEDRIGKDIVDSALFVHRELGPGLLESIYETCLCDVLIDRGYIAKRQVPVPIKFNNKIFEEGFRVDILVNDCVIIEIKTVEKIISVHEAQILSYMKMMDLRLGFLINFKEALVKNGIKRFVRRKEVLAS